MALAAWQATIVDDSGNVQASAEITVLREVAGQPPAQCFSDRNGTSAIGSVFNADADGFVRFHVAGGAYQITATLGAFSRVWRYVAIGIAAETDGDGVPVNLPTGWLFDSSTSAADPGSGDFRLNNATPASATALYIDNENAGGNSVTAWLDSLDNGGESSNRGQLTIYDSDQPTESFRVYQVTGSVVDSTGFRTITISHVAGAGSFAAGTLYSFTFSPKGTTGEVTQAEFDAHVNDSSGAHAASAISYAGGTGMSATDVEAAIDELATEKQNAATALTQGRHSIWVPAVAMYARTTNGAAAGTAEMSTNRNMFKTFDFDTTTQEFVQFEIMMPKSWNEGTVTFQPVLSHASGSGNVVFGLAGVARSNDDAGDVAFGTAQTSDRTVGTANDIYIGPESSAITIAGTPAAGDTCQFQVNRTVASDTLGVDARLHGVMLYITINAAEDT